MKKRLIFALIGLAFMAGGFVASVQTQTEGVSDHFRWSMSDNEVTITGFLGTGAAVIPATINDTPVTAIGNEAFRERGLTSVTIPNSVTHIENEAFARNQLTSVVIPDSVISIGGGAFQNNYLTSITIGANVTFATRWSLSFPGSFQMSYQFAGRQAGTYVRENTNTIVWTLEL